MQYQNDRDPTTGASTGQTDRVTGLGATGTSEHLDGGPGRTEQVKAKARETADRVTHRTVDSIEETAEHQKGRASHQLHDLARSLRVAGDQLPTENGLSRYVGIAATQVDNIASFLDNNDVADLVDDVEDFARRQPALFLGGAFAAGMLGARFLKSSRREMVDEGLRERWEVGELTSRVRDPEIDAVSRPGAPGYAEPSARGEGGFREPDLI